jgi:hypothetical protein
MMSGTALAIPRHSRTFPKGQPLRSMPDGASGILPKRVSTKRHGKMLTSIIGLQWASTVIPLTEQGMIKEGELIQIASKKRVTPSNHSSFMASLRHASSRGSRGRGGTEGQGERSVERFLERLIWTE